MTTSLTGKNQVTVPAAIVKQLGLEPGAKLDWSVGDEPGLITIRVQPSRQERLRRIQEIGAQIKAQMPKDWDPIAELVAWREEEDQLWRKESGIED